MKHSSRLNRIIAMLIVLVMVLQCVPFVPFARAAGNASMNWGSADPIVLYSMNLELAKQLRTLGSGKFELTFTATGTTTVTYNYEDGPEGQYIVFTDGWYLIELFGGSGGDGGNAQYSGKGGTGGAVYAKVYLKKGQVLSYDLGGNGRGNTAGDNNGGDASNNAGGGGGYSAVFLHQYGTTYNRDTNYILIAGGGGGGGSVTGLSNNAPHGGAGGSIVNSLSSGAVTEGVAGTWYAGDNGSSSGSGYYGEGGTSSPGTGSGSAGHAWSEDGVDNGGNSTQGAGGGGAGRGGGGGAGFNGGAGGNSFASLLSIGGGGGGASFVAADAGTKDDEADIVVDGVTPVVGSNTSQTGGSMSVTFIDGHTEYLSQSNFSAQISEYFTVDSITVNSVGTFANQQAVSTVATGADSGLSVDADNVVSGTLDLKENTVTVTLILKANYDPTSFCGGNNVPVLKDASVKVYGITAYFDSAYIFTIGLEDGVLKDPYGRTSATYVENPATDYANVPLQFSVTTHNFDNGAHKIDNGDGTFTYEKVAVLYDDEYETLRNAAGSDASFLSAMTDYKVALQNTTTELPDSTDLDVGIYNISFTVTPKTAEVAEVGAAVVETTYIGVAIVSENISYEDDSDEPVNGVTYSLFATKRLSYDEMSQSYWMKILVEASQMTVRTEATLPKAETFDPNSAIKYYTVPADGWYYIEAWGADGQDSGHAAVQGGYNDDIKSSADGGALNGAGGNGAYMNGLFYLTEGIVLSVGMSAKMDKTADITYSLPDAEGTYIQHSDPGSGGDSSFVQIKNGEVLLVAGGGGGAGCAIAGGIIVEKFVLAQFKYVLVLYGKGDPGDNSEPGVIGDYTNGSTYSSEYAGHTDNYNGTTGIVKGGSASPSDSGGGSQASGGAAGSAGANYLATNSTSYAGANAPNFVNENIPSEKLADETYGQVRITPVGFDVSYYAAEMPDVTLKLAPSDYFDINGIYLDGNTDEKALSENGDTSANRYAKDGDGTYTITVTDVKVDSSTDATDSSKVTVSETFIVYLELTPKDGFLGGNDVPIFDFGSPPTLTLETFTLTLLQSDGNNGSVDSADYANVDLNYDLAEKMSVIPSEDQYISIGTSVFTETDNVDTDGTVLAKKLFTIQRDDTVYEDWQDDFVTLNYMTINGNAVAASYAPSVTTRYILEYGIKVEPATKATVTEPVGSKLETCAATVYVRASITIADKDHITSDLPTLVTIGEGASGTLTAVEGYSLPASVSASNCDCSYDPATGALTITNVTGNVVITGSATVNSYKITFYNITSGTPVEVVALRQESVAYGSDLSTIKITAEGYKDPTVVDGFTFVWQWDDHGTMPAYDLEVYGYYEADLTISYEFLGGDKTLPNATVKVVYGYPLSFFAPVPDVDGYTPDAVSEDNVETFFGTGKTATVTYRKHHTLTAELRNPFGLMDTVEFTMLHGIPFKVEAPEVAEHTLVKDKDAVPAVNEHIVYEGEAPFIQIADPAADTTIQLLYQGNTICYVTITWGSLVYDYDQREGWNGETHIYESIPPVVTGENKVTIENNKYSACPIHATIGFTAKQDYNMSVTYGPENDKQESWGSDVAKGGSVACNIWLSGCLTQAQLESGEKVVGTCTVTISKASSP